MVTAPGRFSITIESPCDLLICTASWRASISAAPPGGSATMSLMVRAVCDHAFWPASPRSEKDEAAKAAAPTAKCRNWQRGSFIATSRSIRGGAHRVEYRIHSLRRTAVVLCLFFLCLVVLFYDSAVAFYARAKIMQWNDRIDRRLKLRDLRVLVAVVKAGSISRAAEHL